MSPPACRLVPPVGQLTHLYTNQPPHLCIKKAHGDEPAPLLGLRAPLTRICIPGYTAVLACLQAHRGEQVYSYKCACVHECMCACLVRADGCECMYASAAGLLTSARIMQQLPSLHANLL